MRFVVEIIRDAEEQRAQERALKGNHHYRTVWRHEVWIFGPYGRVSNGSGLKRVWIRGIVDDELVLAAAETLRVRKDVHEKTLMENTSTSTNNGGTAKAVRESESR